MRVGIYAGSFDPFTNGHLNILQQASELFDVIYVVFAKNTSKKAKFNTDKMIEATRKSLYNLEHNCIFNVMSHDGLISKLVKEGHNNYLIRGLRNSVDYEYEENIAKINKELNPDLNTIYFRTHNGIISSSMVRELHLHKEDISKYVPINILEVIKNG